MARLVGVGKAREVRRGLGWPEVSSAELRSPVWSSVSQHGSGDLTAIAITPPVSSSAEEHEVGLGWPELPVPPPGRHERAASAESQERGPAQSAAVSRETPAPGGGGGGREGMGVEESRRVRARDSEAAAGRVGHVESVDSGSARREAGGELPPTKRPGMGTVGTGDWRVGAAPRQPSIPHAHDEHERARVVPRHAVVRRLAQEITGLPIQETQPAPHRESPEQMRGWMPPVEEPDPRGRTFQGPGTPMIAGTYPGALMGRGESEDEVAIPEPDTSADTPIARAAQAAMKAQGRRPGLAASRVVPDPVDREPERRRREDNHGRQSGGKPRDERLPGPRRGLGSARQRVHGA